MPGTTARGLAESVAARLRDAGHQSFFVGGCVRDMLLGRAAKDFDVSTDATPDEVLKLFPGGNQVGACFGVVLVHEGDAQVEVATFRSDHAYADGRHPGRVVFERDAREDVLRRDFTINALLMDPFTGKVLDYIGGQSDLDARLVRAIGDAAARFREDHLRMLRAVRFAARLGFSIEAGTMAAIQRQHADVARVSPERVRDELTLILTEGGARRGFELLDESGLLADVLPEVAAMKGVEQPPEYHPEGDVWTHTLMMLDGLREPAPSLAWGVLLHDVGKPGTFRVAPDRIRFDGHVEVGIEIARRIMRRLRFSNADCEQVAALIANHMKFKDVGRMRESTLKRFLRQPRFDEHLELHRLDVESSNRNLENYELVRRKMAENPPEQLKPPPLLTGDDLIAMGYRPGPRFGAMLRELEDAQLEGSVRDRDAAVAFVRERWPSA
jgi:poly(A) polymerase